jgi:hypothetical protein
MFIVRWACHRGHREREGFQGSFYVAMEAWPRLAAHAGALQLHESCVVLELLPADLEENLPWSKAAAPAPSLSLQMQPSPLLT